MGEILFRNADLAPGTGRQVYGRVLPYGQVATVDDGFGEYREAFAPGAFERSIAARGHKVRLFVGHQRSRLPVGKAVELREQRDGLYGAFEVIETRDGDDVLTAIRSGAATNFSVGFKGIREHRENGVTVRDEAALYEVSVVGLGAYENAEIAGVRSSRHLVIPRAVAEARLRIMEW